MPDGSDTTRPASDLLLVGGGLANCLIALRLSQARPDLSVRIVEAGAHLGGQHTWSFFETDLTPEQNGFVAPLVAHRWPGYDVRFPRGRRRLGTGYKSVSTERLHAVVCKTLGPRVILNATATTVGLTRVELASGEILTARAVVDGRGPLAMPDLALGFQKFLGQEVRLAAPHGLTMPIIMDATVDQVDGYRFVYVLPLDPHTLLIEDTRYADAPNLDPDALRRGVTEYATSQGWRIEAVTREEEGVLPVALDGDLPAHFRRLGPTPVSGLRAGLFHPTTGYSLPDAVHLADRLAAQPVLGSAVLATFIQEHAIEKWRDRRFYRLLNRMLFRAARPETRYRILERFYRLPEPLIQRFYAARSSTADKLRILAGKPPVSMKAAMRCMIERGQA